jgi:hypothetical protein
MNHCFGVQTAPEVAAHVRFERTSPRLVLDQRGRRTDTGDALSEFAVVAEQRAELGFTDARCVLQHCLEYGLQLAGRAADDLQDLGCRRPLLQRFKKLARARLLGLEQPHVLDRDHRLVGKGVQ